MTTAAKCPSCGSGRLRFALGVWTCKECGRTFGQESGEPGPDLEELNAALCKTYGHAWTRIVEPVDAEHYRTWVVCVRCNAPHPEQGTPTTKPVRP